MAVAIDEYITLISFGISVVSLVFVIFLFESWGKRLNSQYHELQTASPVSEDSPVEVSAIVSEFSQRLRKLEENLIDQKVKMEIFELRASRGSPPNVNPITYSEAENTSAANFERPSVERFGDISGGVSASVKDSRADQEKKIGVTEMEALRLVLEGRGKTSAKEIQQRIGRTREHTARMMNSLYHDGLVKRDVTVRPFSYSITEKGRDLLNS